jgi:hypothetical protein
MGVWEYNIKNGNLWPGLLWLRIFIYCLFNDALSRADYKISKNDEWIGSVVEETAVAFLSVIFGHAHGGTEGTSG